MATPSPTPFRGPDAVTEQTGRWLVPVLSLALAALGQRVLLWLAAIGAGVIWVYAVRDPDVWRIVAAALYSATVLWPFIYRDLKAGG